MKIRCKALCAGFMALLIAAAVQAVGHGTIRLTPADIAQLEKSGAGAGTSGVAGIQTTVLSGHPASPGLYTIRLDIPANTRIEAHTHCDDRSAVVVSGSWRFGYGPRFDEPALQALPPGSFYTEPAGQPHFAQTGAEPVVVYITGHGPTDTIHSDIVNAA